MQYVYCNHKGNVEYLYASKHNFWIILKAFLSNTFLKIWFVDSVKPLLFRQRDFFEFLTVISKKNLYFTRKPAHKHNLLHNMLVMHWLWKHSRILLYHTSAGVLNSMLAVGHVLFSGTLGSAWKRMDRKRDGVFYTV